ncbi:MAG: hypothetical protein IPL77_17130 [Flavobacteriales bacterium]|nr:hypothetical protein [Flavobacteriales bacterium]
MIQLRALCTFSTYALAALALAQAPWTKLYWSAEYLAVTIPVQVAEANNGDLVLFSRVSDFPEERLRFIRLDADGALLSAVDVIPPSIVFPYSLVELADGRWMVGGTGIGISNEGFTMVLDPMGDLLSVRELPPGAFGNVMALLPLADTTALASFWMYPAAEMQACFAVVHPDNLQLTANTLMVPGRNTDIRASSRCADGGAYTAGWTWAGDPGTDMHLTRTDSTGAVQWMRRIMPGGHSISVAGIAEMPDGGALLGGDHAPVPGEGHPFIMRTDATGTPLWAHYLVDTLPPSFMWDIQSAVLLNPDTFLLTGVSGIWTGIRVAVDTNGTVLFADISTDLGYTEVLSAANGDVLTGVIAPSPFGSGSAQGVLRTGADLATGNCDPVPVGLVPMPITSTVDTAYTTTVLNYFWQDVTSLYTQVTPVLTTSDACLPTQAATISSTSGVRVWPVPARHHCIVEAPGLRQVQIHDRLGRGLHTVSLANAQRYEVQLDGLPTGIYHLRILSDAGWSGHAMVKE